MGKTQSKSGLGEAKPLRKAIVRVGLLLLAMSIGVPSWADLSDDHYAVAAGHYSSGRWQLATEAFEMFLTRHAGHARAADARFYLAEALVQLRKYAKAYDAYTQLLERHPQHRHSTRALFRKGETALLSGERLDARRILKSFAEHHPNHELNSYALPYLGELAYVASDWAGAQQHYEQSVQAFPDGPLADEAHLHLGLIDYQQRDWTGALTHFDAITTRFAESSLHPEALHWSGLTKLAAGRWDDAAATLAKVAVEKPDHRLAPVSAYFAGDAFRKLGEDQSALDQFDLLLDSWPKSSWGDDALLGQIHILKDSGDYEAIRKLVDRLERSYPESPRRNEASRVMAQSLLKRQRYVEAIDLLEPLSRQPGSIRTEADRVNRDTHRYLLSVAYQAQKRYEEAFRLLDEIRAENLSDALQAAVGVGRADALIGLENYEPALTHLTAYLSSHPHGSEAARCQANRVLALTRLGRIDEAYQQWQLLADEQPEHPLRWSLAQELAEKAYSSDHRETAHNLFAELVKNNQQPEGIAQGLSGLAWCHLQEGRLEKAVKAFDELITKFPDDPQVAEAIHAQAKALEQLDREEESLNAYARLAEQGTGTPQFADSLLSAARLRQRRGEHQQALQLLTQFTKRFPQHEQLDAALYLWAWTLFDLKRIDDSDAVFTRLHLEYPRSRFWADATYRLADHAYNQKKLDRAAELLDTLAEAPRNDQVTPYVLYLKARIASTREDWNAVKVPLKQLLAEHPDSKLSLPARYWVAESAYRLGNHDAAYDELSRLSADASNRDDEWLAMIPLRLAQIMAHRKQWDEAAEFARQVKHEFPDFPQTYEADYVLGRCFARKAEFQKARTAYQEVLASAEGANTETAAMAQWMIGETFFHQREYEAALRAYLRVEILFDYPRWRAAGLLQAGKCYESLGQTAKAMELYRRIKQKYPETEFTEEAIARLRAASPRTPRTASTPER